MTPISSSGAGEGRTDRHPDRMWLRICGGGVTYPGCRPYTTMVGDSKEAVGHIEYIRADLVAELSEALKEIEIALRKDSREKTITGDTAEYHLDGQTMYRALNRARAALSAKDGR